MASLDILEDELMMEEMSIHFDDSLDLEENIENKITLVGLLIADHEPTQGIVKDVLRAIWTNMGQVKVLKAKENVYSITVGDEAVASRLIDGSPWFIKGNPFTIKPWPLYHSLDDIVANRAVFWVQAHGIPRNFCTMKNARTLGERVGAVLEVENLETTGFRGFLRLKIDFDATKPLIPSFTMPCPTTGKRKIRLKYEGLKDYCRNCGRLGHSRGCPWTISSINSRGPIHAGGFEDLQAPTISKASTHLFLQRHANRNAQSGMDLNKWRGCLERKSGGLYGLSGVVEPEYVQTFVRTQQTRIQTNPTTNTRSAISLQPADLQPKTNSPRIQTAPQPVSASLQPGMGQAIPALSGPTRADYANRWNPDSFGTQFQNGTLTIAVNGLSLKKNWCDPDRVPPWAFENASNLLENRFLDGPSTDATPLNVGPTFVETATSEPSIASSNAIDPGKKKGKGRLKLGEIPIPLEEAQPAKRAKTSHSPLPSCSLHLSNRGGRGVRGRPKGMKGLGQEKRKPEKKSSNPVTDLGNLCDVTISPSKELELAEGRQLTTDLGVFSKPQGGGGWPRTATRGS
ncbi:unnamed protein product [Prunus armeniaca]